MQNIFSKKNIILFGVSVALLVIGFFLLGQKPVNNPLGVNVAPLIIVGVYCVLIPFAILLKGKEKTESKQKRGV